MKFNKFFRRFGSALRSFHLDVFAMANQFSDFGDFENFELQRSEARFRAAVEAVQGILWTNDATGQMRGEQPGWAALTGQTLEQYTGYGWSSAVHPDDAAATIKAWEKAVADKSVFVFEHRLRRRDGAWRHFSIRAVPIFDDMGCISEWVGVHTDVTEQKAAEQLLRESEDRFRRMADNTPVMIWVTDTDNNCTYLNARWYEFNGPVQDDDDKFHWLNATHLDDKPEIERQFWEAHGRREPVRLEYRRRRSDGTYCWVLDVASPRFDSDGLFLGYVGSVLEIDELREVQEQLRVHNVSLEQQVDETIAQRKILADIVDGTDAFVQVIDTEYRILAINAAAVNEIRRIYGLCAKVGDNILELLAHKPEHQAAVKAIWSRALSGEEFIEIGEFGDPDRDRRFYEMKHNILRDDNGRQIGASQFVYDVTDRITEQMKLADAEQARRETDALYRAYFENAPEALFVVRVEGSDNFIVEEINPAHARGVGFKLDEIRGKRVEEILPDTTAQRVTNAYREVISSGEVHQYSEVFDLNGERKHWDTSLLPVRDPDGSIVRIVGSSRDVTRRVMAEEALRQSQKMDAMGQLTGGVAHDFNNLLTPIVGALDILTRRGVGSEREQQLITGAAQSADRAKTLVQRLLAFARRQPLQVVAVDLRSLVDNMAELIRSTTGPQVKVVVEADNNTPPAMADANQVEMAILNLSVNARDAMPDGGEVCIALSAEHLREQNSLGLVPGLYVRLSVSDDGVGMDDNVAKQAIEPFFSTKGIGRGTGLGLYMVHGLAAQLGGALEISSKIGVGTTVALLLPASDHVADRASRPQNLFERSSCRGIVLLVDDEALVRMMTCDMLSELGFDVVEANSAEHALDLVERGLRPDLLMTDHLMPGLTGPELAQELRAIMPDLKVLIVSGYAEIDGVAPELPRLTKPFLTEELVAALAELQLT